MRAVLISSAPPVVVKIGQLLAKLGHEVPRDRGAARGGGAHYPAGLHDVAADADLLFVRSSQLWARCCARTHRMWRSA